MKLMDEYKYKKGDRVQIISPISKYCNKMATVALDEGYGWNTIALYIDNSIYYNDDCGYNLYTRMVKNSIQLVSKNGGNEKMKLSGYKLVAVIEYNSKEYHYALYDKNIVAGDCVLVSGTISNRTDLVVKDVITLEEANERCKVSICEEVKCKIDLSQYEKRVKDRKEKEKLLKQMDEVVKQMDEISRFEMYADRNPKLKDMLDELKKFNI